MRKLKLLPTQKQQLIARDRAIEQAARSGLSWSEQAIAGLANDATCRVRLSGIPTAAA
jgi:hypothetical protein